MIEQKYVYRVTCNDCRAVISNEWYDRVEDAVRGAKGRGWNIRMRIEHPNDWCPECAKKRRERGERLEMEYIEYVTKGPQ